MQFYYKNATFTLGMQFYYKNFILSQEMNYTYNSFIFIAVNKILLKSTFLEMC
jgi:hypothetical protein